MNVSLTNLTAQQLRHAADLRERIDALQNELNRTLGNTVRHAPAAPAPGARRVSPATIAKLRASGRARLVQRRRSSSQPSRQPRRRLSNVSRYWASTVA